MKASASLMMERFPDIIFGYCFSQWRRYTIKVGRGSTKEIHYFFFHSSVYSESSTTFATGWVGCGLLFVHVAPPVGLAMSTDWIFPGIIFDCEVSNENIVKRTGKKCGSAWHKMPSSHHTKLFELNILESKVSCILLVQM